MNRKEANNHIGKQIRVVDPLLGSYIGELLEIIAEPRKPWRGKVKINAIEQYPVQNLSDLNVDILTRPSFTHGEIYEIAGSKIEPILGDVDNLDYHSSLLDALVNEINYFESEKEKITHVLSELNDDLKKLDPESGNDVQYFTILKDNEIVYLLDVDNNRIPLKQCPFPFQIKNKGQWVNVQYDIGLTFIDENKKRYQVKEGGQIRLIKDHFSPYHLFMNELEKPALDSLNSGLSKFDVSHDHCVHCHNSLLMKYLSSQNEKVLKGVNFISYQKDEMTLLVQHHYERESSKDGQDITYDRFEFTNDQGKRLLMTYSTETSR
ncbi:hypothetical protein BKP37_07200 [Anaerobacillus alkalilacustris]|uniref:DUF2777 domain-containing protein n=1 Tax=Anaerobacillus alkalilacustris TaxID=393763 RepID=A0A1S2LQG8_9BACI|nr:DUF2777 family protein [Anaerobacillus alkalilacustris]OIJ14759.1 hypothetical protein BKP37_07200 [Anaerobacillus alkalilacustris]